MWQALRAFFGASLGKTTGLAAIKVWQVVAAITIVSASVGTYTYIRLNAQNDTPQRVVVFIAGLNTSMTNCEENTFQDYGHGKFLPLILSETAGVANPYIKGCNQLDPTMSYTSSRSSMVRFSYNSGAMDSHGFWKPKDYEACASVNKYPLQQDILTFDETLDAYHHVFPNARFTIVGHSMGGLVGLQGAYDYVINKGNHYIDKVITIDSPLKGMAPGLNSLRSILEAKCFHEGPVVEDLIALYTKSLKAAETHQGIVCDAQQLNLSWCQGQKLAQNGVSVITLGNNQDSVYCGGASVIVEGLSFSCFTQTLGSVHEVLNQMYSLTPLPDEGYEQWLIHTPFGNGHFTILSMQKTQLDIARYIFAPVVTINQPTFPPGNGVSISASGTTFPFSASVHCLWGNANHAMANILMKDGKSIFIGTSTSSDESDKLEIKGVVQLPSSFNNLTGKMYVEAGGDTCQYPTDGDPKIHKQVLPTNADYFGGETTGVPFTLTTGTPTTQISGSSSQSQPSNASNDAVFLAQSNTLTVSAGQSFDVYFDYENTGNTTWTDADGYQLVCDTKSVLGANCMGGKPQGLNGIVVPPDYQSTFYVTLTAPIKAGTYETAWSMAQKGATFGQGQVVVKINVTPIPPGTITEFPIHTAISRPERITSGSDGNLWFTEYGGDKIGRITPSGIITEFPLPTANNLSEGITSGSDGNLWFTEAEGNKIGRITPSGTITEFPLPTTDSFPLGITSGPDGNLWFTEDYGSQIGRITPGGTITEFPIPTANSLPFSITSGPDGNLWFTENGVDQIGRITPGGTITEFSLPTGYLEDITSGPDGNLWFTTGAAGYQIGRITPSGSITEFPLPTSISRSEGITSGPDGNLWFTEYGVDQIGRITPGGAITEFPLLTTKNYPEGITSGPDGNLWFTEWYAGQIGRIVP